MDQLKKLLKEKIDTTPIKLSQIEQILFQYIVIKHLKEIKPEEVGELEIKVKKKDPGEFFNLSQYLEYLFPDLDYKSYVEEFVNKYVE